MGILGDLAAAGVGLLNTGYNMYTNKRDFDYQKALQQQMFQREDTAVQRRVEDLKAAGLNPALANGSAAGAGPVVSRSNTNDVNMGAALDMIQAANQIKQQKQQTENLKTEARILNDKANQEAANTTLSKMEMFNYLGLPYGIEANIKNGDLCYRFVIDGKNNKAAVQDMPYTQMFNYQRDSLKNSADILQKQNNWYTTNQLLNAAGSVASGVGIFTPKFIRSQNHRY